MPIDQDGNPTRRPAQAIFNEAKEQLKIKLGNDRDVETSPESKIIEAGVALPLTEIEQDFVDALLNMTPTTAGEGMMERHLQDWVGFDRVQARRSEGSVKLTLKSALDSGDHDPFFVVGDLIFVDTAGNLYDLHENVELSASPSSEVTAHLIAQVPGAAGNIGINGIVSPNGVRFGSTAAQTRFNANVQSFTNEEEFTGGTNLEDPADYLARFAAAKVARGDSSIDGLIVALYEAQIGVTYADGIENREQQVGQEDTLAESTGTGTASQTIDATNTKLAWAITTTERRTPGFVRAKLASDSALVCSVRVETDAAGSPSGVLAHPDLTIDEFDFDGTNSTIVAFDEKFQSYLPPGTYHTVFTRVSGSGTFDGSTGGTAHVKIYNGSWANDATVTEINAALIGGLPIGAYRMIIEGGTDADVGKVIHKKGPMGGIDDGKDFADVTHVGGGTIRRYFERPSSTGIVVSITVTKLPEFTGDADAIRDVIVRYVGGTLTDGTNARGLGQTEKLIRLHAISRVLRDDSTAGLENVTEFLLARESLRATPDDLLSGDTSDLVPAANERFKITDPATQIKVVINEA